MLEYTISDPGTPGTAPEYYDASQILVKGSDWSNLLGTAKFSHADLETGKVLVGVTQDMLDNCGGKIFLQGAGDVIVTKVTLLNDKFNPENVLAWGERILGSNIFVTIPEEATHLVVVYDKAPEWSQICNSGWANLELNSESANNEDGTVTIKYELTLEAIDAINSKKEVVVNAKGAKFLSMSVEGAGPKDPNLIFEGEATLSWNEAASVNVEKYDLKVGDVITYTITDVSEEDASWGGKVAQGWIHTSKSDIALGTVKFNYSTLKLGTVQVGITQELLDAAAEAGGSFSLKGTGFTLTKAYINREVFDAKDVLAWGKYALGAEITANIPEGTKYINATFTKVPEWLMFCYGGWDEKAQPVNRIFTSNEEPVTYQFEATPETLAGINEQNNLILNGKGAEFVSLSVSDELILDYDVEKLKRVESVEDVPASYATPLDIAYEELPGLGKGSQLVITYTRGTTDLDLAVYAVEEGSEPLQISGYYPPYGTGYVIIPLTEEQVVAISKGILRIEGHDMIINKIYYSEGEEITGISDITVDENAPVEYFNLQGIKISADDATNGIFIRRQGGKSVKVAR